MPSITLYNALTTNTASTIVALDPNRTYQVSGQVTGTFGGATVKLQVKLADGNWYDVPGISLTSAGQFSARLLGSAVRLNCSGGTAQSINATAVVESFADMIISSTVSSVRADN